MYRDGCAKMFSLPLAANKATANTMKGLEINNNFDARPGASAEMAQLEDELAAELAQEASKRDKDKDKENSPDKSVTDAARVTPALSRQTQANKYVFSNLHCPNRPFTAKMHLPSDAACQLCLIWRATS